MANEARHHHYIPQCYLRGFATGSGKQCRLTVANLRGKNFFETNPRNVAGIRDFNRVDLEGHAPDALEAALSKFEGEVAPAMRNVVQSRSFGDEDRNAVLNLIALLAVRSPQQRENWRQFEERIMKQMLGLSLATKERWEGQMAQMKEAGYTVDEELSYEQMKEFWEKDEYDIRLNREHHIGLEFAGHNVVLRALVDRKWRLFFTNQEKGPFVTTDRPVVLTWNEPGKVPPLYRQSPGFGMPETEVLFPLTQNALLVGAFEGKDSVEDADMFLVAGANGKMIGSAFEQVYAPKRVFPYVGPGMTYHRDRHFMEVLKPFEKGGPMEEAAE